MLKRRTDLAVEAEALTKTAQTGRGPEGVRVQEEVREGCPVTRVEILDDRGEAALGRPVGTYVTVSYTHLRHIGAAQPKWAVSRVRRARLRSSPPA